MSKKHIPIMERIQHDRLTCEEKIIELIPSLQNHNKKEQAVLIYLIFPRDNFWLLAGEKLVPSWS
jgi:hypothetical protein